MLREWKENFVRAQKRSERLERRAAKADADMRARECEIMAWAKAQSAARENVLSGMY